MFFVLMIRSKLPSRSRPRPSRPFQCSLDLEGLVTQQLPRTTHGGRIIHNQDAIARTCVNSLSHSGSPRRKRPFSAHPRWIASEYSRRQFMHRQRTSSSSAAALMFGTLPRRESRRADNQVTARRESPSTIRPHQMPGGAEERGRRTALRRRNPCGHIKSCIASTRPIFRPSTATYW